jgi:hypothetical protein
MNTLKDRQEKFHRHYWAMFLVLTSFLVGCQKKCPIPKERQTSVSSTPWRLVYTSDPDPLFQSNLDSNGEFKYTFLVWNFTNTFDGDIKLVQNNTQYDQAQRTFRYDIDSSSKQMLIKFAQPTSVDISGQPMANGGNQAGETPILYSYQLGRTLELVNEQGFYYKFVPFTGILAPDDTCTFN